MKSITHRVTVILLVVLSFCLVSCEKNKKQGKVIITGQEFVLRQDKENLFTIDAKGMIRNVGDADVKNVVVTGYCRSCSDLWIVGQWVITPEIEKMPYQKDVINYLPIGNEESFSFQGIADLLLRAGQDAPELPEKLEVTIESFEIVE